MLAMIKKVVLDDGSKIASFGINEAFLGAKPRKCTEFTASRDLGSLPQVVDLREHMTEVEDQSQSNSCCANACAGAYEYLCKKQAAANGDDVGDISRLFIYYVGRKADQVKYRLGNKPVADEGMSIAGAVDALQTKGACLANTYPFDLSRVNHCPHDQCFEEAMNYKISEAKEIPVHVESMKACLAEGYPIVFGLKLTQAFMRPPPSGHIQTPDPNDPKSASHGLHAMLMVGYSEKQQVFIVRNSWGSNWGDRGYCYIPYDYAGNQEFNFCGMYSIRGLTDFDFTPEEKDDGDLFDSGADDGYEPPHVEEEEEEVEAVQDDSHDWNEMFNRVKESERVFRRFDSDGSGAISIGELQMCLMCNGIFLWPWQLQDYMRRFDQDGNGTLSFHEFLEVCGIDADGDGQLG